MVVDDALDTGQATDGGMDQRAELIDQPPLQERAIDRAASLEEQCLDAEDGADLIENKDLLMNDKLSPLADKGADIATAEGYP